MGSALKSGDVLVIGPEGRVVHAAEPNATNLAGVYSTRPGFVGDMRRAERGLVDPSDAPTNEPGDTWLPVALLGVVPVKATADGGAIRPGDLLTTSVTPGHAMRATPVEVGGAAIYPAGAILGKALEPLASGKGKINVLLIVR
jgi:hypothetical protein